jgi:hypothetical protein
LDAQASAVRQYFFFADSLHYEAVPASEETLIAFAVWSAARVEVSTVRKYLSHVRSYHLLVAKALPAWEQMPMLNQVLTGLERMAVQSADRKLRLPITLSILVQMFSAKRQRFNALPLADRPSIYSMDHPVFSEAVECVAFLGAMRPGEVAVRVTGSGVVTTPLLFRHWSLVEPVGAPRYACLSLPKRKTDQLGERCDLVIGLTGHSAVCAVSGMEKYFIARAEAGETLTDDSLLFPVCDKHGKLVPLSYDRLTASLAADLALVGYSAERYQGHSFRIGAATTMGMHGVPTYWIEELGQWAPGSRAMRGYIRLMEPQKRAEMTAWLTKPYQLSTAVAGSLESAPADGHSSQASSSGASVPPQESA